MAKVRVEKGNQESGSYSILSNFNEPYRHINISTDWNNSVIFPCEKNYILNYGFINQNPKASGLYDTPLKYSFEYNISKDKKEDITKTMSWCGWTKLENYVYMKEGSNDEYCPAIIDRNSLVCVYPDYQSQGIRTGSSVSPLMADNPNDDVFVCNGAFTSDFEISCSSTQIVIGNTTIYNYQFSTSVFPKYLLVEIQGAGGGGGGGYDWSFGKSGGGGGAGAYVAMLIDISPGRKWKFEIGKGGSGGAGGAGKGTHDGSNGGDTILTDLVSNKEVFTAGGGEGGKHGNHNSAGEGGSGGLASESYHTETKDYYKFFTNGDSEGRLIWWDGWDGTKRGDSQKTYPAYHLCTWGMLEKELGNTLTVSQHVGPSNGGAPSPLTGAGSGGGGGATLSSGSSGKDGVVIVHAPFRHWSE